jgi:hypothetical protein
MTKTRGGGPRRKSLNFRRNIGTFIEFAVSIEKFDNLRKIVYIDAPEAHAPIRPAELQSRKRLKADRTASKTAALAFCG